MRQLSLLLLLLLCVLHHVSCRKDDDDDDDNKERLAQEFRDLATEAWNNGNIDACIHFNRERVRYNPKDGNGYQNLGAALIRKGDYPSAIEELTRATKLLPRDENALLTLGMAHEKMGDTNKALKVFEGATRVLPKSAQSYSHLGNALRAAGKLDAAEKAYRTGQIADGLGSLLLSQQRYREALGVLEHSSRLEGEGGMASMVNLALLLGRVAQWERLESMLSSPEMRAAINAGAVKPFHALEFRLSLSESRENAKLHSRNAAAHVKSVSYLLGSKPKLPKVYEVFSVGYVSGRGWCSDTTTAQCLQTAFHHHNKITHNITCIGGSPPLPNDGVHNRIRQSCPNYVDISRLSSFDAARVLYGVGMHVMVDVSAHTLSPLMGVIAFKPAPVQLHWHGFPGSIGADYIDWYISDVTSTSVDHAREEMHEKLLLLPHTYLICDNRERQVSKPENVLESRVKYGFNADDVVLACFNQYYKMHPDVVRTWISVMAKNPRAKLWMMKWSEEGPENIRSIFRQFGIEDSRIVFHEFFHKKTELSIKGLADVFLDTPLFNAHTTATDVLWAGVPILTLPGAATAQRVAASLVKNTSQNSLLIVRNMEDYDATLTRMVQHVGVVRKIKEKLWESREKDRVFDVAGRMREVEKAQKIAWELHTLHRKFHGVIAASQI